MRPEGGPEAGGGEVHVHASVTSRWLCKAFKGVGVVAMLGGALAFAPSASAVIPPTLEDEGAEERSLPSCRSTAR